MKNVPWLLNSSDKYVEKSRSRSMRAKEILRLEKPKDVVFDHANTSYRIEKPLMISRSANQNTILLERTV